MKAITRPALLAVLLVVGGPCVAQTPPAAAAPEADGVRPAAEQTPATAARPARKTEKLELQTTTITGNRELPRVMYVVPWKHPEAGDLRGKPLQSLVEEALAPVDRDVFNREISYFRTLQAARDAGVETSVTAGQPAP